MHTTRPAPNAPIATAPPMLPNGNGDTNDDTLFPMADQDRDVLMSIAAVQKANAEALRNLEKANTASLKNLADELKDIKEQIRKMNEEYVPRREVVLMGNLAEKERETLKTRLHDLEEDKKKARWAVYGSLVAALISAAAALVVAGLRAGLGG